VVIVGGGFAGLNVAKGLRRAANVRITLIDRRNYHLFQPLLYQVAMAGLSPADIAAPIRSMLSRQRNVEVVQEEVVGVDFESRSVLTRGDPHAFDYLVLACGAQHSYFGRNEWEEFAPGLKTIEQATEIRRRVLTAFENAERTTDPQLRKQWMTFVVVGGGPTGVELAGAIGEMSRFTLARDFRHIDSKLARVILIEAGPRILPAFSPDMASRAVRELEELGVQVWTDSRVTNVDGHGVEVGDERIRSATVLWAAGVEASSLGKKLGVEVDPHGRILVGPHLTIPGHDRVFVAGDQAAARDESGDPLPGVAPVAMQQGRYIARTILDDLAGRERRPFHYVDKGRLATIGRSRAVAEIGRLKINGFFAWLVWLVVHIYYLTGFRNRLFVVLNWAWSYLSFKRGARLIVGKEWRTADRDDELPAR
jgi:NADH dehydrogenase